MTTRPLLLVSKSVRALLDQVWQGPLGQLFTPRMLTGLDITEGCSIQWAADNDCFAGFHERRYLDMLEAITYRSGCLFVVARSEEHTSELQSHHDLVCRLLLE